MYTHYLLNIGMRGVLSPTWSFHWTGTIRDRVGHMSPANRTCRICDFIKYVSGQLLQFLVPRTAQRIKDPCGPPSFSFSRPFQWDWARSFAARVFQTPASLGPVSEKHIWNSASCLCQVVIIHLSLKLLFDSGSLSCARNLQNLKEGGRAVRADPALGGRPKDLPGGGPGGGPGAGPGGGPGTWGRTLGEDMGEDLGEDLWEDLGRMYTITLYIYIYIYIYNYTILYTTLYHSNLRPASRASSGGSQPASSRASRRDGRVR